MPADRRRRQRDSKPRLRKVALLLRFALYAAVIGVAVLAGYLLYLDRVISETFEGRRWSVPARVYAQPLEIYPGLGLSVDEFEVAGLTAEAGEATAAPVVGEAKA